MRSNFLTDATIVYKFVVPPAGHIRGWWFLFGLPFELLLEQLSHILLIEIPHTTWYFQLCHHLNICTTVLYRNNTGSVLWLVPVHINCHNSLVHIKPAYLGNLESGFCFVCSAFIRRFSIVEAGLTPGEKFSWHTAKLLCWNVTIFSSKHFPAVLAKRGDSLKFSPLQLTPKIVVQD